MKFKMRELTLQNFNIIPFGDNRERPECYERMIKVVSLMKREDKDFMKHRALLDIKKNV